jgi:Contractile injection system tube protein
MTASALQKASLQPFSGETAETIELMFNPTQLAFARTVKWQSEQGGRGKKTALPKVNFSGVDPYKLTLNQLVFDTYEEGKSVIDKYIKKLKKGVESPESQDGQNKRPPVYILMWGGKSSFPCVMTSLSYKLDMFLPDGTPVRALVDISLQEVDMENPPGDMKSDSKGAARSGADSRQARQGGRGQPSPKPSRPNPSDF